MISQKTRTNAVIAYFFLGWIFLLARHNPDFEDPFIRSHAKTATKGHLLFFVGYIFYSHFLSRHFIHTIPLLGVTIDRVIELGIFAVLTGFILLWAYRAGKGSDVTMSSESSFGSGSTIVEYKSATEAERMILLLSFIPFFGRFLAQKHPSHITTIGSNIGTLFIMGYGAYFIAFGLDSLSMIALFLYILLLAFTGVRFFFSDSCPLPWFFARLPSLEFIWQTARSLPAYIMDIVSVSLWKKDALNFSGNLKDIQTADQKFKETMEAYFQDEKLFFPKFLIFIPIINIIFLPKIFLSRNTKYVLAIGQGIIVSLLTIAFALVYDFSSRMQLLLIFPILLGITSLPHDTFYRIPFIYELYAFLNTITFWLLENTRKIKAVQQKEQSVSFKVQ